MFPGHFDEEYSPLNAVEFGIRALSCNCPLLHRVCINVKGGESFGNRVDAAANEWEINAASKWAIEVAMNKWAFDEIESTGLKEMYIGSAVYQLRGIDPFEPYRIFV